MPNTKNRFLIFKNSYIKIVGILLLLALAATMLWCNNATNYQAFNPFIAQVQFRGEYRIGDGPWQQIIPGQHISSSQGDVTLRGNFHMLAPDGEYVGIYRDELPIAFYLNHINATVYEQGSDPFFLEAEDYIFGSAACGEYWLAYSLTSESEDLVEILIRNPHKFGNENAIDELIDNFALWSGIEFEKTILNRGKTQRNTGLLFVIVAFVLLGSALFSALLHIQNNRIIWMFGAMIFSAGMYLLYSAPGVSFWNDNIIINTTVLGIAMMFYMLFISGLITYFLRDTKRIGYITTIILGVMNGIFFILPMSQGTLFYDTWLPWIFVQSAANIVLFFCLAKDFITANKKDRMVHIGIALFLLAFEADIIATAKGFWVGGLLSKYVFYVLFIAVLFVVLQLIPQNINAAEKAKELEMQRKQLEAELKESRISLMLSQIQPHFIYNTLGTIERMCLKDPQKAFELVRNFSLYLRGNFSELDSVTPIRFTEELKHVEYYVKIVKVRFPDMDIQYNIETTDFVLPALSVQPLVENAIKHGLMRLETGGTIVIHSYETPTHFCVEVKDNGVGFDITLPIEEKKHVGLRNIRGRLNAMVNGELTIESQVNVGTKAVIMIPKEVIV